MALDNPIHIAFVLLVALLVFGAKRLPELGRSLGGGMRGFKEAITGEGALGDDGHGATAGAPAELPAPAPVVVAEVEAHERHAA